MRSTVKISESTMQIVSIHTTRIRCFIRESFVPHPTDCPYRT